MKLNKKIYFLLLSLLFAQQTTTSEHKCIQIHNNNNHPLQFLFSSRLDAEDMQKTKLLLSQGAHPNITHYCNNSLLHSIIEKSDNHDVTCEFVQLLSEHKANVNAKNDTKETPLILAIKKGNEQLVKLLLEQGADPNIEDKHGNHTIHMAMEWDIEKENPFYKKRKILPNIVMLLLQYNADPNKAYHFKHARPLHAAVFHNAPIIVQTLLDSGAHQDVYDERGFTPLSLAEHYQYMDIVNILAGESKKVFSHKNAPPNLITIDEEIQSFHEIKIKTIDEEIESFHEIIIQSIDEEIESFHMVPDDYQVITI